MFEAVMSEIVAGMRLTRAQVTDLEADLQADPSDLVVRAKLIGFYGNAMSASSYSGSSPSAQQVAMHALWLIENAPEEDLTGTIFCVVPDGERSAEAESIWRRHLKARADDARVNAHAARFFQHRQPQLAKELIARAQQLDPTRGWRLHEAPKSPTPPRGSSTTIDPTLDHYYKLTDSAKCAVAARNYDEAKLQAEELLALSVQVARDWNYGNAIYYGHQVLGLIALAREDLDGARSHLLQAAATPGSPQLNSFGPQLDLAHALLERGEREVVLAFLEKCHGFWSMGHGQLDAWSEDIRQERSPDLGSHLAHSRRAARSRSPSR